MTPDVSRYIHLGEMLRDALLTFKSNTALIEADRHRELRRLTYAELLLEVETVCSVMQTTLRPGQRCAILMSNQSRWVSGAMAGLFAGAVLVPLDYKLTTREQLALLARAQPQLLVVEYPVYRDLAASDDDGVLSGMRLLVCGAPEQAALGTGGERFPEADAALAERCQPQARQREDPACVVYSSGTAGEPKGCVLTHDNYLQQVQALLSQISMAEEDRYFSVLPTNHAIDFLCSVLMAYLFGAAVVHQRTLRSEFLVSTMARYHVSHTALVPRILKAIRDGIEEQIAELPEWKQTLLRGLTEVNDLMTMKAPQPGLSRLLLRPIQQRFGGKLRAIFAGGAYVDPELANYFYRLGLPVIIGYGLTESCAVATLNDLSPFRANTVGRPIPGLELEVRNQDAEGVGEVFLRGPTVMAGYEQAPDLTREVLQDGWLRTGDVGCLDAAGHLQLRGRSKNMVVTDGGKNVYPEEVEAWLEDIPCEELCVMAGSYVWPKTALSGAKLVAVVRPLAGQSIEALRESLLERNRSLLDYKRLGAWVLVNEAFPVTASMKIKRAQLAQELREAGVLPQPLEG